jgi:hypothetical protein
MSTGTGRNIVVAGVAMLLILSSVVFAASALAKPAAESSDSRRRVDLTFTKWVTITPGGGIMQGFVGGDVVGNFAGQVLVNKTTDLVARLGPSFPSAQTLTDADYMSLLKQAMDPPASGDINVLQAVYEVQAADKSFRALVQGGYDIPSNKARLDGVVLGGWLTGGTAHVEFQAMSCNPVQSNADGNTCYVGTIRITPDTQD